LGTIVFSLLKDAEIDDQLYLNFQQWWCLLIASLQGQVIIPSLGPGCSWETNTTHRNNWWL